jgi:hypothetical protein
MDFFSSARRAVSFRRFPYRPANMLSPVRRRRIGIQKQGCLLNIYQICCQHATNAPKKKSFIQAYIFFAALSVFQIKGQTVTFLSLTL